MRTTKLKKIILAVLCACMLASCMIGCNDTAESATENPTDTVSTVVDDTEDTSEGSESKPGSKKEPLNMWTYTMWKSLNVRELTFDSGLGGEEVTIIQLTDTHFGGCTEQDLKNPTLASTYENRTAFPDNLTIPNVKNALDYADSRAADQIVITGDCLDFLSQGSMNSMKENVWDRYRESDGVVRKVMALMGNHDMCQQMTGTVPETLSKEERLNMVEEFWEHDPYYYSKVIKNKVMLIAISNGNDVDNQKFFYDGQAEKLSADIATARANGYTVLLFCHAPLNTNDGRYFNAVPLIPRQGPTNLFNGNRGPSYYSKGVDGEVYNIIANSADVIAGVFNGHYHSDYYTEIKAKTPDGTEKSIPQYTLCGNSHDGGHVLKITVK